MASGDVAGPDPPRNGRMCSTGPDYVRSVHGSRSSSHDQNERHHKITRARADEVRVGLTAGSGSGRLSSETPVLQVEAFQGTLGDLQADWAECHVLPDASLVEVPGIGESPTALIRARIERIASVDPARTGGTNRLCAGGDQGD